MKRFQKGVIFSICFFIICFFSLKVQAIDFLMDMQIDVQDQNVEINDKKQSDDKIKNIENALFEDFNKANMENKNMIEQEKGKTDIKEQAKQDQEEDIYVLYYKIVKLEKFSLTFMFYGNKEGVNYVECEVKELGIIFSIDCQEIKQQSIENKDSFVESNFTFQNNFGFIFGFGMGGLDFIKDSNDNNNGNDTIKMEASLNDQFRQMLINNMINLPSKNDFPVQDDTNNLGDEDVGEIEGYIINQFIEYMKDDEVLEIVNQDINKMDFNKVKDLEATIKKEYVDFNNNFLNKDINDNDDISTIIKNTDRIIDFLKGQDQREQAELQLKNVIEEYNKLQQSTSSLVCQYFKEIRGIKIIVGRLSKFFDTKQSQIFFDNTETGIKILINLKKPIKFSSRDKNKINQKNNIKLAFKKKF